MPPKKPQTKPPCPLCKSTEHVIKDGRYRDGRQRHRCKSCNKVFFTEPPLKVPNK